MQLIRCGANGCHRSTTRGRQHTGTVDVFDAVNSMGVELNCRGGVDHADLSDLRSIERADDEARLPDRLVVVRVGRFEAFIDEQQGKQADSWPRILELPAFCDDGRPGMKERGPAAAAADRPEAQKRL